MTQFMALLENAATSICDLPVDRWAGWVTYLLEAIESRSDDPVIAEHVLREVREAIVVRLAEGRW